MRGLECFIRGLLNCWTDSWLGKIRISRPILEIES